MIAARDATLEATLLLGFSLTQWFADASHELVDYFHRMDTTHWMVISASAVVFGFFCLRGNAIN